MRTEDFRVGDEIEFIEHGHITSAAYVSPFHCPDDEVVDNSQNIETYTCPLRCTVLSMTRIKSHTIITGLFHAKDNCFFGKIRWFYKEILPFKLVSRARQ